MKKTIMVVDDEPDNRTTVKLILEKQGYTVLLASDGDECLQQLKKAKPDLILLDIMMPGTPVQEIVPHIKKSKIVYLSVVRTSEAERLHLLKQENVVGFIQKPFDLKELVKKVKQIVA